MANSNSITNIYYKVLFRKQSPKKLTATSNSITNISYRMLFRKFRSGVQKAKGNYYSISYRYPTNSLHNYVICKSIVSYCGVTLQLNILVSLNWHIQIKAMKNEALQHCYFYNLLIKFLPVAYQAITSTGELFPGLRSKVKWQCAKK